MLSADTHYPEWEVNMASFTAKGGETSPWQRAKKQEEEKCRSVNIRFGVKVHVINEDATEGRWSYFLFPTSTPIRPERYVVILVGFFQECPNDFTVVQRESVFSYQMLHPGI